MWPDEGDERPIEVPVSAIEHYSYCPRQCALIHVEQVFDENVFTVRGRIAHERVDAGVHTVAAGVRVSRDLAIWSERLGLRGRADLVEFRPSGPFPVEYKVGRPRAEHAALQLCAQALCLEEMLGTDVRDGAIYAHADRRRHPVTFTASLRQATIRVIEAIRLDLADQRLPPAVNDSRCPNCSLLNACLPSVVAERPRLRGIQGMLFQPLELRQEYGDA